MVSVYVVYDTCYKNLHWWLIIVTCCRLVKCFAMDNVANFDTRRALCAWSHCNLGMHVYFILVWLSVITQSVRPSEAPSTIVTYVRFDLLVNVHVLLQVALMTKGSSTDTTCERLFPSVGSLMIIVCTPTHKELLAKGALPLFLGCLVGLFELE